LSTQNINSEESKNLLIVDLTFRFLKVVTVSTSIFFVINTYCGTLNGIVVDVHDGDTLTIKSGATRTKVRLAGIDAPELNQFFGVESRNSLRSLALNKEVQIETLKYDKYKRLIGRVLIDGKDLNLEQLKSGAAWVYLAYSAALKGQDLNIYINAESNAQLDGLGLWNNHAPTAPWVWRQRSTFIPPAYPSHADPNPISFVTPRFGPVSF
jgi:endonuclease YncB( thermonuclease family)